MRFLRDPVFIIIVAVSAFLVIGVWSLDRYSRSLPKRTCADYASFPRERVPARCFADYRPERP